MRKTSQTMIARYLILIGVIFFQTIMAYGQSTAKIPFQVAKGYYFRGDIDSVRFVRNKITSKKAMDSFFGFAAFMGKEGKPTEINFSKNFVICVVINEVDKLMELSPIGLTKKANNRLEFHFKMLVGEKMTSRSRPILLVLVDNKYKNYDIQITRTSCLK